MRTEIPQICVRDCSGFWASPGSNDLGSTPKTSERRGGGSEDNNSPASALLASAGSLKIAIIRQPCRKRLCASERSGLICRRRHQPRRPALARSGRQFRRSIGFDPAPFCAAPSPNQNRSLSMAISAVIGAAL